MPAHPQLRAVLVSALAGYTAWLLHIPLPWMIGPMVGMASMKMRGIEVRPLKRGREAGQLIIGTAVGLYFTPAVMHEVWKVAGLMLLAGLASIGIGYATALVVSRLAGVDRKTAFFASVPGGASEMVMLGERYGSHAAFVAMAQSLRMMLVVLIVPLLFALSGVTGSEPYVPATVTFSWSGFAALLLAVVAGGMVLHRIGAPTPWMLGPLMCAVAITASGYSLSSMPGAVSALGQALIGCALGCRFQREFLLQAPRMMSGVVAGVLLTIAMSALLGIGLASIGGLPWASLILATAPGGFAEMAVTAKVLQLGVPLVAAFHVTRLLILLTMTAPIFHLAIHVNRYLER